MVSGVTGVGSVEPASAVVVFEPSLPELDELPCETVPLLVVAALSPHAPAATVSPKAMIAARVSLALGSACSGADPLSVALQKGHAVSAARTWRPHSTQGTSCRPLIFVVSPRGAGEGRSTRRCERYHRAPSAARLRSIASLVLASERPTVSRVIDHEATARALVHGYVQGHLRANPEDASTLGVLEAAGALSDPSIEHAQRERARLEALLRDAAAIDVGALSLDARLDLDAAVRSAGHYARWYARDEDASNLELAALPNAAVQHALLHIEAIADVEAVARRAEAVPAFLTAHAENLRRGAREGRGPDRAVLQAFIERVLPGAMTSMDLLPRGVEQRLALAGAVLSTRERERVARAASQARAAYVAFAGVLAEEIAPRARERVVLGEAEVALRLRDTMGLDGSIDSLRDAATEALARSHAALVEHARSSSAHDAHCLEDARAALYAVFGPKPETLADAVARYQLHIDAATRFVRARGLLTVPDALSLSLAPMPPGVGDGVALTNWPAPLLQPHGRGHALYATEPSAHPLVQARNLAVHEAIPGHYLQSAAWQRSRPSVVRFLGVADDVAMSRGYFGAMLSVEGWAVHMEQLLCAEGFYEAGAERIFFAFCDAIRAMRVLLDLGLHAGAMSDEECVRMVSGATLMSEGWARAQLLRSKRVPLQSSTYFAGERAIAALRAGASGWASRDFYDQLLSYGPVPPSRLGGAFAARAPLVRSTA